MELKVKNIKMSSGGPQIAILNEKDAIKLDVTALERIKINKIIAVVDITKGNKEIKEGEIGLFNETANVLKIKDHQKVKVSITNRPNSIDLIRKKLQGVPLTKNEIYTIVNDIVDNKLSEIELTYFVSACYTQKLSVDETKNLTEAIISRGKKIDWGKRLVVDKHCLGGVPGNRTTPIIVSIVAAMGLTIPKTSSRSITSAAGTADTIEVLAKVTFNINKIKEIVNKTNACMVWGGALELASADDKLIKIERPLSLDPQGILLASIMAKKAAVGSKYVLIDIPIGKSAKIKTKEEALILKEKFIQLGKSLGIKVKVVITDGSQPIGNGIGPALEALDVLTVLKRNKNRPLDLEKKSVYLAGELLEMVGIKNSEEKAYEILNSGKAFQKLCEIVKAQEGSINHIQLSKFQRIIKSEKHGTIQEIDNKSLSKLARITGAPQSKGSGVYIFVHKGNKVKSGDNLFTIYAENENKLKYSLDFVKETKNIFLIR